MKVRNVSGSVIHDGRGRKHAPGAEFETDRPEAYGDRVEPVEQRRRGRSKEPDDE